MTALTATGWYTGSKYTTCPNNIRVRLSFSPQLYRSATPRLDIAHLYNLTSSASVRACSRLNSGPRPSFLPFLSQ